MPGYMARAPQMLALNLSNGGVFAVIYLYTPGLKPFESDVLGNKTVISSQTKLFPQGPGFSYHNTSHLSPFVAIACLRISSQGE